MKYPIFAFVAGGLLVQAINTMAAGKSELRFGLIVATCIVTGIGACFEAVWNFKS